MKRKKILGVIAVLLFTIVAFCGIAAVIGLQHSRSRHSGGYVNDPEIRIADDNGTIGRVSISTLPLEEGEAGYDEDYWENYWRSYQSQYRENRALLQELYLSIEGELEDDEEPVPP